MAMNYEIAGGFKMAIDDGKVFVLMQLGNF